MGGGGSKSSKPVTSKLQPQIPWLVPNLDGTTTMMWEKHIWPSPTLVNKEESGDDSYFKRLCGGEDNVPLWDPFFINDIRHNKWLTVEGYYVKKDAWKEFTDFFQGSRFRDDPEAREKSDFSQGPSALIPRRRVTLWEVRYNHYVGKQKPLRGWIYTMYWFKPHGGHPTGAGTQSVTLFLEYGPNREMSDVDRQVIEMLNSKKNDWLKKFSSPKLGTIKVWQSGHMPEFKEIHAILKPVVDQIDAARQRDGQKNATPEFKELRGKLVWVKNDQPGNFRTNVQND